jgi:putative nucleotidyltransferase with HDIG domain
MAHALGAIPVFRESGGVASVSGQLAQLSGFLEGLRVLRPDRDPDLLQWTVVEKVLRSAEADGCSLALESDSEEWFVVREPNGSERRRTVRSHLLSGSAAGLEVLREGTLRLVAAIAPDRASEFPAYAAKHGFRSAILLPVLGRSGIVGVLSVYYRDEGRAASESFESLVLLNHVASVALENASLFRELQKSYFSTVESLTSAIDAVSPATHGHSKRVTQFALMLGEALRLDADALSTLRFGALLHDIGKLGVRASILEKMAPLSSEEFESVKEHPVIGERIIAPVEFLQAARPIVRHHHERWDGRGYPDRLRGEEIPLGARIVALADFYDAMISARPYKGALSPQDVRDEIRREAGARFDPDLSERFLQTTGIAR